MQFWPRKRAKRAYARIRSWPQAKDASLMGFAGYKVGMTHVLFDDKRPNALTKGEKVMWPVTIIECPPLTIHSARFYQNTSHGKKIITEILNPKQKKSLGRKVVIPKSAHKKFEDITDFDDVSIIVHTNPELTGIGKKKPDIFEVALGGSKDAKLNYAKENLGKDIPVQNIVKQGALTDIHAVSIGKGYQGMVKRYGVSMRSHKSEKARRVAVEGPQGISKVLYTVPKSGKMGYHQRTIYNQLVVKVGDDPQEINALGGFVKYGVLKNPYLLIKGSIPGHRKRLAILTHAIRPNDKQTMNGVSVYYIKTESNQGR